MENTLATQKQERQNKWIIGLLAGLVFLCLYIFFTRVHPLYIHDFDDWFYLYISRTPYPNVREINPIKILPETWMVITSYIGAYVFYPMVGDYTEALCIAYAIVLSGMITLYVLGIIRILGKRYQLSSGFTVAMLAVIFLLSHFLPFVVDTQDNTHLFYAYNVTCVFNYTLPALINLIMCTYFFDQNMVWKPLSIGKTGLLLLALYLTIFSSLFHSIVLMSLFGMQLLFALMGGLFQNIRNKKPFLSWQFIWEYIQVHYPKLLALLVWFISMVFQMGGRGDDMKGVFKLMDIFYELYYMRLNGKFFTWMLWTNAVAFGVALWRLIRYRETKFLVWQAEVLGCMCLIFVYLILVIGRLSSSYMVRPDVMIDWMSLAIFATVSSMAYLVKQIPKSAAILPLLVFALLVTSVFHENSYADYNFSNLSPTVVKAINQDIIDQVKAAEEQGLTAVDVYVPESLADGWPLDTQLMPQRITDALYCHNITDWKIDITIVPSPEKDAKFHLNQ